MNKINTLALIVSSVVASQAFAAEADRFGVELYGKLGVTHGETDGFVSDQIEDGFSGYEDSKIGVLADYRINDMFAVHGEIKTYFEGRDIALGLQELYISGDMGHFGFEAGRLRTPLYMNSEMQDQDFSLNTYRVSRGFSTEQTPFETVDGASLGFKNDIPVGHFELNGLVGVAKDREIKTYSFVADDSVKTDLDTDLVWQVETTLDTEFGTLRAAHLKANDIDVGNNNLALDFDSTSVGYAYNSDKLFVEAEVAKESFEDVDSDKLRGAVGYHVHGFTPYIAYSEVDYDESNSRDMTTMEAGVSYQINRYAMVKGAYENVEIGDTDENVYSIALVGKF